MAEWRERRDREVASLPLAGLHRSCELPINTTWRQRISCLVREALSFSKRRAYHIGAITLFTGYYNLTKAPALHR
jgi:hypothetical protein